MRNNIHLLFSLLITIFSLSAQAQTTQPPLQELDIFELEYVSDPQISPDGKMVVYRRMGFDIMKDRSAGNLWMIQTDGSAHQKLSSREVSESQAKWSPSGDRIAFVSSTKEGSEIYVYWKSSNKIAKLTQLEKSPSNLAWSPDGKQIAFTMKIDSKSPILVSPPSKPKGAKWAASPRITDRLKHEADGSGYISPGFTHIFVLSAEGGTPRQITTGDYNHSSNLIWTPDGKAIVFSANRFPDWEYRFRNSEIYKVSIDGKEITALTERDGPDYAPQLSPDGKYIAYISYEDQEQTYQLRQLYIMNMDGSNKKLLSADLDHSVNAPIWQADSKGIYFTYDHHGNTKIGHIDLNGKHQKIADDVGGTTIGRPYASGSFSMAANGTIAFTKSTPAHPAELAILTKGSKNAPLITELNNDLLPYRSLGRVEEVWYTSSVDQRDLQGWLVYPPNFEETKKYPLLVENHGGPILNYGDRFSAEMQLYAAAGYLVFYPNPRGSTSYGETFGNLLYHNYPSDDYQDVMDGVDHLIGKGLAHEDQLFVTGGSAGGIMTAWIIGKNNRFEAAAVVKPVMNWISKTLVADNYYGYANTRYPGQPWENWETYWKFSPISLVGNIQTPTMVMVGMNDLRTPPSEAKQLYHALKLRKIETVLVEIPGASHGIARRPSQLITKVAHTLAWFELHRKEEK
ncbi:MAG: S9 family peptidase [Bacteroidota bacterium]